MKKGLRVALMPMDQFRVEKENLLWMMLRRTGSMLDRCGTTKVGIFFAKGFSVWFISKQMCERFVHAIESELCSREVRGQKQH